MSGKLEIFILVALLVGGYCFAQMDQPAEVNNSKLLECIMADQCQIIAEVTGKPATETPQIWALYSEVLEYYNQMKSDDSLKQNRY